MADLPEKVFEPDSGIFLNLRTMFRNAIRNLMDGLRLMVRPMRGFSRMFQEEPGRLRLLQMMLAGIILVQFVIEIGGMHSSYKLGQLMSASLVLGPLVGILLMVLMVMFSRNLAAIFNPEHHHPVRERHFRAPIPLRGLLWNLIFGRRRISQALDKGALQGYQNVWNKLFNGLNRAFARIIGGPVPYKGFFIAAVRTTNPILLMALVYLFEYLFVDLNTDASVRSPLIWVRLGLAIWFFALWYPLLKVAYRLSWGKTIAIATLGFWLGGLAVAAILRLIFAVPIPGL